MLKKEFELYKDGNGKYSLYMTVAENDYKQHRSYTMPITEEEAEILKEKLNIEIKVIPF